MAEEVEQVNKKNYQPVTKTFMPWRPLEVETEENLEEKRRKLKKTSPSSKARSRSRLIELKKKLEQSVEREPPYAGTPRLPSQEMRRVKLYK